jgi:hypothetical protein
MYSMVPQNVFAPRESSISTAASPKSVIPRWPNDVDVASIDQYLRPCSAASAANRHTISTQQDVLGLDISINATAQLPINT